MWYNILWSNFQSSYAWIVFPPGWGVRCSLVCTHRHALIFTFLSIFFLLLGFLTQLGIVGDLSILMMEEEAEEYSKLAWVSLAVGEVWAHSRAYPGVWMPPVALCRLWVTRVLASQVHRCGQPLWRLKVQEQTNNTKTSISEEGYALWVGCFRISLLPDTVSHVDVHRLPRGLPSLHRP